MPNHIVRGWLDRGLLEHSGKRGIYVRAKEVEALVKQHLAAAKAKTKRR